MEKKRTRRKIDWSKVIQKGWVWMGRLWLISTGLVALGISLVYIILFYPLLVVGAIFFAIDIALAIRGKIRSSFYEEQEELGTQ